MVTSTPNHYQRRHFHLSNLTEPVNFRQWFVTQCQYLSSVDIFFADFFCRSLSYKGAFTRGALLSAVKKRLRCRFIVWYQVFHPTFPFLPPGHWTCSFVSHFNFTENMQSCSHFGTLNLSYTLPYLSYQVLIFTWVKWNSWGLSVLPKDTNNVPILGGEKHDISLKILHQDGIETARRQRHWQSSAF